VISRFAQVGPRTLNKDSMLDTEEAQECDLEIRTASVGDKIFHAVFTAKAFPKGSSFCSFLSLILHSVTTFAWQFTPFYDGL